jgi:hypothetical protein
VIPVLWRHIALETAMMGRQTDAQGHLFYDFRLDAAVPDDHPVRRIDAVLDLSWVYVELAPLCVPKTLSVLIGEGIT